MLLPKILQYLNHKLLLARVSPWYQSPEKKQAVDWAFSLQQFFKYKGKYLSDRDVAMMILPNEKNLDKLLPSPLNKSFKTSVADCEKIKEMCKMSLTKKTIQ